MTRRHNCVGVRLKLEYSSHFTQIHRVAQKLALAAGQACSFNFYEMNFNEMNNGLNFNK